MANGVSSGVLSDDRLDSCILAAGTAVAWIFAIELNVTIFMTFKRSKSLYFWSLLISSWGLTMHALGFIFKFLVGTTWRLNVPLITTGWVAMVTGQALVLYSRLHLVVRNPRTLRYALYLILFDAVALHVPTMVLMYGSNSIDEDATWIVGFNVMERIQLAGFCVQETIISAIYIWSTVRMLHSIDHCSTRKVWMQLVLINLICIGMDVVLICLEYKNKYAGEASIKPMIYAIKLKLEFAVLNQLMDIIKAGPTTGNSRRGGPSHQLHYHASANGAPPETKPSIWGLAKASKNKPLEAQPQQGIYKTQQVQVFTETADEFERHTLSPDPSSPCHRVLFQDHRRMRSRLSTDTYRPPIHKTRNPHAGPTHSEREIFPIQHRYRERDERD